MQCQIDTFEGFFSYFCMMYGKPKMTYVLGFRGLTVRQQMALYGTSWSTGWYTRHSNLGGPAFKSLPRDPLSWGFSWFYSVAPAKCQDGYLNWPWPLRSTSFPNYYLFILTIRRRIVWETADNSHGQCTPFEYYHFLSSGALPLQKIILVHPCKIFSLFVFLPSHEFYFISQY
jgi:hypothetical protein